MNKEPVIKRVEAFRIVGIERYTVNGLASIGEAWDAFFPRLEEVKHRSIPPVYYGYEDYSRDLVMTPGEFPKYFFLAGVKVEELADIPQGMVGKEVPSTNCSVFTYRGPLQDLHESFRYIYETWLPGSGFKMDPAISADFERYPERITDPANALVDIHVPVVKKAT